MLETSSDDPDGGCCAQGARVGAIGPGGCLDVSGNVVLRGIWFEDSRGAGVAHGAAVDPGNDERG